MEIKLYCKYTNRSFIVKTSGGTNYKLFENNMIKYIDKGNLLNNPCPFWGECPYNNNHLVCSAFNDLNLNA